MIKLIEGIVPPPTGRGPNLHETLRELRIKTLPVTYNRDIDRNADGTIDERDRGLFRNWIRANISWLYCHPACLDYENPFWTELADLGTSPERFREVLTIYHSILAYAKRHRPLAKWGFFGLPRKLNFSGQTEEWRQRVLAFSNLLRAGSAAFPSIYDPHVGDAAGRHPEAVRNFIALCLEAAIRTPVYVIVSGRYHRSSGLTGEAR